MKFDRLDLLSLVLRNGPTVEFSKELGKSRWLVMCIQTARVWEYPGVTTCEGRCLQAHIRFLIARNHAV